MQLMDCVTQHVLQKSLLIQKGVLMATTLQHQLHQRVDVITDKMLGRDLEMRLMYGKYT